MLKRDLFRVVVGVVVIANAASVDPHRPAGRAAQAPIDPLDGGQPVSDPLARR